MPGAAAWDPTATVPRFPADSPAVRAATHAQGDELSAVLEITDVAPVSVPHRIRGRAWVSGWLTCVPGLARPGSAMMLRLEAGRGVRGRPVGRRRTSSRRTSRGAADPLVAHETELLQHLHAAHSEQMAELCGLLGERADGDARPTGRAVPVALDRFGLRVRFVGERLLRRALRVPQAGARRRRAAPGHAHALRGGALLTGPARPGRALAAAVRYGSGASPRSRSRTRSTTSAYRASAP